ncbi:hypothetical protein STRTUCAR8_08559 [Streptomyces turgidiscabies Car8]|uniref:Uncharacterized protein n=1 Tax=Streptomyces turgidiscabies (strain Car8) TaxID=698760 RepID=L7F9G2_STRT8|nr:hypothetical protein [Streptomyces turgidiscabies]ELP67676.1 hypothetical protein STRTUCAR8_08559 [Streptomyces turgidiscabies Car8]
MSKRLRALPDGFDEFRTDGRRRCWARSKKTHGQCGGMALTGQNICFFHGGNAPQSLKAGEQRVAEEKARALVATYGRKIETTATEALLDEVQWTAGHVAWLRERVQEIESDAVVATSDREHPLVWGVTREKSGGEDRGTTEEAAPNIWLKLYQQERTHLVRVCAEAIKAGIEERRVRLAESQGALVAQAIRAILADLNLTGAQQQLVSEVVPRHLRALASA